MWVQNDMRELEQIAEETLAFARTQGDQLNTISAMILYGAAMLARRDYAEAQEYFEEALTMARAFGDHLAIVSALVNLGNLAWYQGDPQRAITLLEESLIQCRATGEKFVMSAILVVLAQAELSQGQTTRARTLLEEDLIILSAFGNSTGIALVLGLLGQLAFQQGEMDQAASLLKESVRLASEVGDQRSLANTRLLLATLAVLQGDYMAARMQFEESLTAALNIGRTDLISSGLKGLACAAAQSLGSWAAMLWGAAEGLDTSPTALIPPEFFERMVTLVRTRLGEQAFIQAKAKGQAMTPEQVLAAPESLLPANSQEVPTAPVSSSLSSKRASSNPAGLTDREVEVLRHVAQSLTDAQIAEQLVISPRTVTTHLTSIYNKPGVNSRVAATRFAVEQHLC